MLLSSRASVWDSAQEDLAHLFVIALLDFIQESARWVGLTLGMDETKESLGRAGRVSPEQFALQSHCFSCSLLDHQVRGVLKPSETMRDSG